MLLLSSMQLTRVTKSLKLGWRLALLSCKLCSLLSHAKIPESIYV